VSCDDHNNNNNNNNNNNSNPNLDGGSTRFLYLPIFYFFLCLVSPEIAQSQYKGRNQHFSRKGKELVDCSVVLRLQVKWPIFSVQTPIQIGVNPNIYVHTHVAIKMIPFPYSER